MARPGSAPNHVRPRKPGNQAVAFSRRENTRNNPIASLVEFGRHPFSVLVVRLPARLNLDKLIAVGLRRGCWVRTKPPAIDCSSGKLRRPRAIWLGASPQATPRSNCCPPGRATARPVAEKLLYAQLEQVSQFLASEQGQTSTQFDCCGHWRHEHCADQAKRESRVGTRGTHAFSRDQGPNTRTQRRVHVKDL